jgi:Fic family protein
MSFSPRFTITNAITANLTSIERARGFLEAAALSEEWMRRMSQRALLLEAHHTTHIEGTHLTIDQAERLWAGERVTNARADDVRELLNYREAFNLVSEYLHGGEPVTEGLIREIHKRLVDGVRGGSGGPGTYRMAQNFVANSATGEIVYTPPSPIEVPALMQELVAWLREDTGVHPVLVAGIAQFQLVHIHPFLDGNGRTSRLLSTLCLYRSGYDFKRLFTISEFYDRDRSRFYRTLQDVRERGMDLTGWLEFFVEGLATQLAEVKQRGEVAIRSDVVAKEYGLTERQQIAMQLLLETAMFDISMLESRIPDVSRRTLQRDLADLEAKGLVVREGETNKLAYWLSPALRRGS